MFELRPFSEPNASSRLTKFYRNILMSASIEGADCVEDFPSFIACETASVSVAFTDGFGGGWDILSKERACSAL